MTVLIRHRAAGMTLAQYDQLSPRLIAELKNEPGFVLHTAFEDSQRFLRCRDLGVPGAARQLLQREGRAERPGRDQAGSSPDSQPRRGIAPANPTQRRREAPRGASVFLETATLSHPGARSSAGERPLHTREVAGSIPAAPIAQPGRFRPHPGSGFGPVVAPVVTLPRDRPLKREAPRSPEALRSGPDRSFVTRSCRDVYPSRRPQSATRSVRQRLFSDRAPPAAVRPPLPWPARAG